jgi:ribosomal protein S18 acetylase RimI-like enzyme
MPMTPLPTVPGPLAARGVTLRLRTADDDAFLRDVYIAYRWEEMTVTGWPEAERVAFLRDQERMQRIQYDRNYPDAAWGVIEVAGVAAGRLYLELVAGELRIIDIAFMPPWRGQGIGGGLLTAVQAQAQALGARKVSIHVEQNNPALRLYQRLGFQPIELRGIYWLMEWPTGVAEPQVDQPPPDQPPIDQPNTI